MNRRRLLAGLAGCGFLTGLPARARLRGNAGARLRRDLAALEARAGGRLGLAILDSRDGTLAGFREDERFTLCSTFKLSLAAMVLAAVDGGAIAEDAMLPITAADPVGNAPAVRAALARGERQMGLLALAEAAQTQSDNGAANILLRALGGPEALTRFWRALGDRVSRLDRYEPELNTSHDGDPRDTSSPAAMAGTMQQLLAGPALKPESRARLIGWMVDTRTGLKRLRAGLPAGWRAGDKTGTMNGAAYPDKTNDIAIVWHPRRGQPFLVAAFLERRGQGDHEAVLAEAGRLAARWIDKRMTAGH